MESNIIGKGTFGSVRRDQDVAIKQLSNQDKEYQEEIFIVESTVCKYLTDTYTINCLAFDFNTSEISMQFGLPTLEYIKASSTHRRSAVDSLIAAVQYMHSRGLLHLDIKPENTIVVDNHLKLLDFGLTRYIGHDLIKQGTAFSEPFRPPELFQSKVLAYPSLDIWATGMTIYSMLTDSHVFTDYMGAELSLRDINDIFLLFIERLPNVEFPDDDKYYHGLLNTMIIYNPRRRTINKQRLVPLEIPQTPLIIKRLPERDEEISTIDWFIQKYKEYQLSLHALFLAVKIFYTHLDPDNVLTYVLACMKLGKILINSWDSKLNYEILSDFTEQGVEEDEIQIAIQKILKDGNYNLRAADSFLYFNEYQVKQAYRDETISKTFIEKLYYLMLYDGSLFALPTALIFDTFLKLDQGHDLNKDEKQVHQRLIETLKEFDQAHQRRKSHKLFDQEFREKLLEN